MPALLQINSIESRDIELLITSFWISFMTYQIFEDPISMAPIPSSPPSQGLWEVPMVMWEDLRGGRCSMGDARSTPPDAEGIYKMLIQNFERHYTTNRYLRDLMLF